MNTLTGKPELERILSRIVRSDARKAVKRVETQTYVVPKHKPEPDEESITAIKPFSRIPEDAILFVGPADQASEEKQ